MKKDNTYNDEFLDALADKLLDKLLERCSQPEWHVRRSDDFVNNLSGIIAFKESEEERNNVAMAQASQPQVEVEIVAGDILTSKDCYILHQCNCVNAGAGGLAEVIFQEYLEANTYRTRTSLDHYHVPGSIDVRGRIINCYSQLLPSGPAEYAPEAGWASARQFSEVNPNADTAAARLELSLIHI